MATDPNDYSKIDIDRSLYWKVVAVLGGTLFLSLVLRIFTGGFLAKFGFYTSDWLTLLLVTHFLCSWKEVPTNYIAGMTAFNRPVMEMGSGWYYVPFLFCKLHMFPMSEQQEQFPSDPENINKRPDTSLLGKDEFRPIRLITGPGSGTSDDVLDAERSSPEVTFSVRWQPRKKSFFELAMNVPGDTWDEKHFAVRKAMRDTGEGLLTREAAKRSPAKLVDDITEVDEALETSIQLAFERYDIEIIEVLLQAPDFGTGVNHALAEVLVVSAKAKQTGISATAERNRLTTVAEGEAEARIKLAAARTAELAAEGEGRKQAAAALGMSGAEYMALEQAPKLLGDKTVVVGTQGIADVLGLAATLVPKPSTKK